MNLRQISSTEFNFDRYSELLKQNQSFQTSENLFENPNYLQLLKYELILWNNFLYTNKSLHINLLTKYLDNQIDVLELHDEFFSLHSLQTKEFQIFKINLQKIEEFKLDVKADKFGSLINNVFGLLETFFYSETEVPESQLKFNSKIGQILNLMKSK